MKRSNDSRTILQLGVTCAFVLATTLTASVAMAHRHDCGQPQSEGSKPAVSDALTVLRASIGIGHCDDEGNDCECDVDGSGKVTPGDAVRVLRFAVGFDSHLECEPGCVVSTTTSLIEGVTTTSLLEGVTTTSLIEGVTTTTLADDDDGQDVDDGDTGEFDHHDHHHH